MSFKTIVFTGLALMFFFDCDLIELAYAKDINPKQYTKACNELARCVSGKAVVLSNHEDYACKLTVSSGKTGIVTSSSYFRYEIAKCWEMRSTLIANQNEEDSDETDD